MNKKISLYVLALVLLTALVLGATSTKMSLQGKAITSAGVLVNSGDLTVTLDDEASCSGSSILFNQTYTNSIENGYFDILLGNATDLNLEYNKDYWVCIYVNDELVGGAQRFVSGQGEINTEDMNLTGNFSVDDDVLFVDTVNDRVGIGTTSPTKGLQLQFSDSDTTVTTGHGLGSGAGPGAIIYNTLYTNQSYANLDFRTGSADGRIAYVYQGKFNIGDFHFITDNDNSPISAMVIKNDGNVGIGTSSPDERLSVVDGSQNSINGISIQNTRDGNAARGGINFINRSGSTVAEVVFNDISLSASSIPGDGNDLVINQKTENSIVFATNLTEVARINEDGNFGIGTDTPLETLDVRGNLAVGSQLNFDMTTNDNSLGAINYDGYLSGTTQFRDLSIYDGKRNSVMFVDGSAGSIGIGTNSPSSLLHLYSDSGVQTPSLMLEGMYGGNEGPVLDFYHNSETPAANDRVAFFRFQAKDSAGNQQHLGDMNVYYRDTTDGSEDSEITFRLREDGGLPTPMKINGERVLVDGDLNVTGTSILGTINLEGGNLSADYVGIGTDSPDARLEVHGSGSSATNIHIDSDGHTSLQLDAGSSSYNSQILFQEAASSEYAIYYQGNANALVFYDHDNGNQDMTIKNGDVGIGTDSPSNRLDIEASSTGSVTRFTGTGSNGTYIQLREYGQKNWYIGMDDGGADLHIKPDSIDGTPDVTIMTGTGNVGIGTASPGQKLHVAGNINTTGNIYYDGSLVPYSPLVIHSADDKPIPICMKADDNEWVGCKPRKVTKDGEIAYRWSCQPDIECDQKLIRTEVRDSLKEVISDDDNVATKIELLKERLDGKKSRKQLKLALETFESQQGIDIPTKAKQRILRVLNKDISVADIIEDEPVVEQETPVNITTDQLDETNQLITTLMEKIEELEDRIIELETEEVTIPEINETVELNKTEEINETEEVTVPEINETVELNVTVEQNLTQETNNSETNSTVPAIQGQAVRDMEIDCNSDDLSLVSDVLCLIFG